MHVTWTLPAKYRLKEIFLYYKHHATLQTANKITTSLLNATKALSANPKMGNREKLLQHKKEEYRYLVEGNYKIIYKINSKAIFIIDVFDCRQNPKKLLKNK